MLWIKAFHIIAMVAWFAGLFYLPRLFVYHSETTDEVSDVRFKCMERRLYYGITWPAALTTTILGCWLLVSYDSYMLSFSWMHLKLGSVGLLWVYHGICGRYVRQFRLNKNKLSSRFYRLFNEIPTVLLVLIVILVVVRPM